MCAKFHTLVTICTMLCLTAPTITTLLKNTLMLNCYLLTKTVFTYEIKSEDVYEEFFKHKHLFDFSNYPKNSKFLIRLIKKLLVK